MSLSAQVRGIEGSSYLTHARQFKLCGSVYVDINEIATIRSNLGDSGMLQNTDDLLVNLFHLNHWAKTGDVLTRRDREVLYEIKCAEIRKLTNRCLLSPTRTVERRNAPLDKLHAQGWDGPIIDYAIESDVAALSEVELRETLNRLYRSACRLNEPLCQTTLEEAGFDPREFAYATGNHVDQWDMHWGDVVQVIDPCWYWLIEFRTPEELPRFCFHLPYRTAELFVRNGDILGLGTSGGEFGEQIGRPITEEESLKFPILKLAQFFGKSENDFPNLLRTCGSIEKEYRQREKASSNEEWGDDN